MERLLPEPGAGMLVLANRYYGGYPLGLRERATCAELLCVAIPVQHAEPGGGEVCRWFPVRHPEYPSAGVYPRIGQESLQTLPFRLQEKRILRRMADCPNFFPVRLQVLMAPVRNPLQVSRPRADFRCIRPGTFPFVQHQVIRLPRRSGRQQPTGANIFRNRPGVPDIVQNHHALAKNALSIVLSSSLRK